MHSLTHKFNSDIGIDAVDRRHLEDVYPNIAGAFIDPELIGRFVRIDALANEAKRRSRRSGAVAVLFALLCLVMVSAAPIYHARWWTPWTTLLDGVGALCGVAGVAIGYFGVLHSHTKRAWLQHRWQTERMRQFHFQYNATHLADVLALGGDAAAGATFLEARRNALTAAVPLDDVALRQRFDATTAEHAKEDVWLTPLPQAAHPPNPAHAAALKEWIKLYGELRISHQIGYCEMMLGRKRGPLDMTLDRQEVWAERLTIATVLVLLLLHLGVAACSAAAGVLEFGPEWMRLYAESKWTHAAAIWLTAVALGVRVLADGYGLRADLARYHDYLAQLQRIESLWHQDQPFALRMALVVRLEDLAFAEMISFLHTTNRAAYVL
jgi:hypothetical protein